MYRHMIDAADIVRRVNASPGARLAALDRMARALGWTPYEPRDPCQTDDSTDHGTYFLQYTVYTTPDGELDIWFRVRDGGQQPDGQQPGQQLVLERLSLATHPRECAACFRSNCLPDTWYYCVFHDVFGGPPRPGQLDVSWELRPGWAAAEELGPHRLTPQSLLRFVSDSEAFVRGHMGHDFAS